MPRKATSKNEEIVGLFGIGLDNEDGHQRLTRGDDMLLIGGSEETHEKMQDVSMRFSESLKARGKVLTETTVQEVIDMLHKAMDR